AEGTKRSIEGKVRKSEGRSERASLARKARFEARAAGAVATGPWLRAGQGAASRTRMSVLSFFKYEKLFPVLAFFEKRRRAETHLDPPHASIITGASARNVAKIFVACDRAPAERSRVDGGAQRG